MDTNRGFFVAAPFHWVCITDRRGFAVGIVNATYFCFYTEMHRKTSRKKDTEKRHKNTYTELHSIRVSIVKKGIAVGIRGTPSYLLREVGL